MDVDEVVEVVRGIPHMNERRGRRLHRFLLEQRLASVLELGTAHGVSTCYLAAAVDELDGRVTTIDRRGVEKLDPDVWTLLDRTGLRNRVRVVVADTSYTWELMRWLRDRPGDRVDFCFFDAGHNWDETGYAFFLVDRLLRPGGWMLFDDVDWTYASSPSLGGTPRVQRMPEEQRTAEQVRLVLDLLVRHHPDYGDVEIEGRWGWVRKRPTGPRRWLPRRLPPVPRR